jgi:hypothetical protein
MSVPESNTLLQLRSMKPAVSAESEMPSPSVSSHAPVPALLHAPKCGSGDGVIPSPANAQ